MKKITTQKEINKNNVSSTKMLVWGSLVCFLVAGYFLSDPRLYNLASAKATKHLVQQKSSKGGGLHTIVIVEYKFEADSATYDGSDSIWFTADTRQEANKLAGAYQKSHAIGSYVDVAFLKIKPTYNFFHTKLDSKIPPMLFTSLVFWGVFMAIFLYFLVQRKPYILNGKAIDSSKSLSFAPSSLYSRSERLTGCTLQLGRLRLRLSSFAVTR